MVGRWGLHVILKNLRIECTEMNGFTLQESLVCIFHQLTNMNLSAKIIDFFESRGHTALKRHGGPFSSAGEPDIDVWLWYGSPQKWALPVRIEVKRGPKDKPTKIQWHRMIEAEARGIACYVAWDIDHARQIESFWKPIALGKKKPGGESGLKYR